MIFGPCGGRKEGPQGGSARTLGVRKPPCVASTWNHELELQPVRYHWPDGWLSRGRGWNQRRFSRRRRCFSGNRIVRSVQLILFASKLPFFPAQVSEIRSSSLVCGFYVSWPPISEEWVTHLWSRIWIRQCLSQLANKPISQCFRVIG